MAQLCVRDPSRAEPQPMRRVVLRFATSLAVLSIFLFTLLLATGSLRNFGFFAGLLGLLYIPVACGFTIVAYRRRMLRRKPFGN